MRRLAVLLVLALVGATFYGLSSSSSGISVNHQTVSGATLRSELAAISENDSLQCYITALDPTNYGPGAGGASIKASGAAGWTNLRVEGLAINQYVEETFHYYPNAAELAKAKVSLEDEMTEAAKSTTDPLNCPGSPATALAEMPSEMRTAEIQSQATSAYLVAKVRGAIPLTAAAMKEYYNEHVADYDTLCVSIALVTPADVSDFEQSQEEGLSVASLAKTYSQDYSATKGAAYGCFAPSNSSYDSVRADVGTEGLDTFPTTPQYIDYNDSEYALYVAVTKRTTNPYSKVTTAVLADLESLNAEEASLQKDTLLKEAAVYVDPSFGRWGTSSTVGPTVFAASAPKKDNVTGASRLSAESSAASYK